MSEPEALSPLVPLSFLALTILSLSCWSTLVKVFFASSTQPAPVVDETTKPKKKKKGQEVKPKEIVPDVAPAITTWERVVAYSVVAAWVILFGLVAMGFGMGDSAGGFDPYKILNVTEKATKSEVKKVYYTLSKEYHPDRLKGRPESERVAAEQEFVQISRAYKTLTEEEAYNNWVTHGHPDGPRSSSISFGIPEWMTKKENETVVIGLYLGVFAVVAFGLKLVIQNVLVDEDDSEDGKTKKE